MREAVQRSGFPSIGRATGRKAYRLTYRCGFGGAGNYTGRWGVWRCRVRQINRFYYMDIRCVNGSLVVRWQYQSGE
jgi:hypothetical protein